MTCTAPLACQCAHPRTTPRSYVIVEENKEVPWMAMDVPAVDAAAPVAAPGGLDVPAVDAAAPVAAHGGLDVPAVDAAAPAAAHGGLDVVPAVDAAAPAAVLGGLDVVPAVDAAAPAAALGGLDVTVGGGSPRRAEVGVEPMATVEVLNSQLRELQSWMDHVVSESQQQDDNDSDFDIDSISIVSSSELSCMCRGLRPAAVSCMHESWLVHQVAANIAAQDFRPNVTVPSAPAGGRLHNSQ
jgi:hypothetical protein